MDKQSNIRNEPVYGFLKPWDILLHQMLTKLEEFEDRAEKPVYRKMPTEGPSFKKWA